MLEQTILPQLSNFAQQIIPLLQQELDRLKSAEEHDSKSIKDVLNMFCKLVATIARIAKLESPKGSCKQEQSHAELVSASQEAGVNLNKTLKRVQGDVPPPQEILNQVQHDEFGTASLQHEKSRQQRRSEARALAKQLVKLPQLSYLEARNNYQATL